jgi:hypothetical protein
LAACGRVLTPRSISTGARCSVTYPTCEGENDVCAVNPVEGWASRAPVGTATLAITVTRPLERARRGPRRGRPARSPARVTACRTATCPAACACVSPSTERGADRRFHAVPPGRTARISGARATAAPMLHSEGPAARPSARRPRTVTPPAPALLERSAERAARWRPSARTSSSASAAGAPLRRAKGAPARRDWTAGETSPVTWFCERANPRGA